MEKKINALVTCHQGTDGTFRQLRTEWGHDLCQEDPEWGLYRGGGAQVGSFAREGGGHRPHLQTW